jgi:hypothetical protein
MAAPAFATTHVLSTTIGAPGSGAGQLALLSPVYGGPYGGVEVVAGGSGVAVGNATHDVYVADTNNHRVAEFELNGTFVRSWGWGVAGGVGFETCTSEGLGCKIGASGSAPGQFVSPLFVAVDNSSGPSKGDVYVADSGNDIVSKFTSEGALIESWGVKGQLTGSPTTPFGPIAGIAVSSSGALYVLSVAGEMFTFDQSGGFLSAFKTSATFRPIGIALTPNGSIYAAGAGAGRFGYEVDIYGSSGAILRNATTTGSFPSGFALDGVNSDLYVDHSGVLGEHYAQEGFVGCVQTCFAANDVFGSGDLEGAAGLAVDPSQENVYAADAGANRIDVFSLVGPYTITDPASAVTGEGATLNAHLGPTAGGPIKECRFEYVQAVKYHPQAPDPYSEGQSVACSQSLPIESPMPVSAPATGLALSTVYDYRISATDSKATAFGSNQSFRTLGLAIDSTSASQVSATAATINTQINPFGEPATFHFEYLTQAAFQANGEGFTGPDTATSIPVPDGSLGSGSVDVEATEHLQGLAPGTTYRYRVVGFDAVAPPAGVDGPALSFTTQGTGGALVLPDGRQWELVSPPVSGAGFLPLNDAITPGIQAAAAGGAMAFMANAPAGAEPQGNSNYTQILAARGPAGWRSRDLAIPHTIATAFGLSSHEYPVFSSDLSLALAQPFGAFDPSLSVEASEQTGFLRTDYLHGEPADFCTSSCYRPLVTAAEGFANVPEGIVFGAGCPPNFICGPQSLAATPDLSHVVVYSGVALTPGGGSGFYEWSAGQLQPIPGVGQPAAFRVGTVSPTVIRNAISLDGSRVYYSGGVRVGVGTPEARTVPVPGGEFETASVNGETAYVLGGGVLSRFSLEKEASTPTASGVLGVIGASEDGSIVYFVSTGVLTGEQLNPHGQAAQAGEPNLYVDQAGATTFIATLSSEDSPDWEYNTKFGSPGAMTARVSPDGRYLAFMSQRPLTGYDNTDVSSPAACGAERGICDEEVYLYHAQAGEAPVASLVCASCDPTGARPHGIQYSRLATAGGGLTGGVEVWNESQWLAANVPGWTSPYRQSRYLSNQGRLFFNSSDALVPQDVNNTEDVYQFEPPASAAEPPPSDTCTTGSSTYSQRSEGCVALVSSGTSSEESAFLDASENGDDVFFLSSAKLTPQGPGGSISVYDAHACSASSPCPPPPPPPQPACEGDACQSPVAAPEDSTPGSLTFHGPGNALTEVKPPPTNKTAVKCKKPKKLSHGKCVKPKPKKRKAKKSAHTNRRASR